MKSKNVFLTVVGISMMLSSAQGAWAHCCSEGGKPCYPMCLVKTPDGWVELGGDEEDASINFENDVKSVEANPKEVPISQKAFEMNTPPTPSPTPHALPPRDPENPNPGACSSFHIHC